MKKLVLMCLMMFPMFTFAQKDKVDFSGFAFEITNIKVIGEELIINMMITNKGESGELKLLTKDVRMFDTGGNEFKCTQSSLGKEKSNYVLAGDLLKDVPVKAQLIFKGIPATRDKIVALEVPVTRTSSKQESKLQFSDLSIPYKAKLYDTPEKKEVMEDVFMKIKSVKQDGGLLLIEYLLTNMGDELVLPFSVVNSRMIDEEGNEYKIDMATSGKEKSNYLLKNTLITGVPISGTISFKISGKIGSIALLELSISDNIHRFKNLKVD